MLRTVEVVQIIFVWVGNILDALLRRRLRWHGFRGVALLRGFFLVCHGEGVGSRLLEALGWCWCERQDAEDLASMAGPRPAALRHTRGAQLRAGQVARRCGERRWVRGQAESHLDTSTPMTARAVSHISDGFPHRRALR